MMDSEQLCETLGIEVTVEQLQAMRFLEFQGLKFCGDFGYENAISMANDLARKIAAEDEVFLASCGIADL